MKKAIKESKWYWYIPIVWLFCLRQMTDWTYEPDTFTERTYRFALTHLLMFPSLFVIIGTIQHFTEK